LKTSKTADRHTVEPIGYAPRAGSRYEIPKHHLLGIELDIFPSVVEAAETIMAAGESDQAIGTFTCNVDHM